jgi:hypothetical protein
VDWHKNRRVEATNTRSQGKREGRKGKVPTPGDGKRSKESKSMEATAEQTEENESPKVRDVTEEESNCPGAVVDKEEGTFTHEEDVHEEESAHA